MRAWLVLAVICQAAGLSAGNLERFFLGDDAALMAGAVAATASDPGSIYYNPAGLARLEHSSVDLGVSAYAARYYRVPGLAQIVLPDQRRALDFQGTSFFSTPAAVAFGFGLRPGLGASFAVFTRDQLDLQGLFSGTFIGMNGSNPYIFEQGVELDFRSKDYLAGGGLGWEPAPGWRLGLSAFGEYQHQSVATKFWGDYKDPSSYNPVSQLYGNRLTTSFDQRVAVGDYGLRAVTGLQAELGHGWSAGLVGRSPRFTAYQDIGLDMLLDANVVPGPAVVRVHVNGDGVLHPYVWEEPWRVESGLAWTGEHWDLALQGDASDRPDDEGRGAVWNWKLGARYRTGHGWEFGGGAYSDRRWDEKLVGFAASNIDYYGGNLGARWSREIGRGGVELSTALTLHYERGTGEIVGALVDATLPQFPVPEARTNATFEEANLHLSSGLAW